MTGLRRKYTPEDQVRVKAAILKHVADGMPGGWRTVANSLNVPPIKMYQEVYKMQQEGLIPPKAKTTTTNAGRRKGTQNRKRVDYSKLLELASDATEVLSTDQMLKIFSHIVIKGDAKEKISAANLLTKLRPVEQERIGPPPPSTPTEEAERLSMMLLSVSAEVRSEALKITNIKLEEARNAQLAQEAALQNSAFSARDGDAPSKVA